MTLVVSIFIAFIAFVVGLYLYERYKRAKLNDTHCYTFTIDQTLIYVTSSHMLSDDELIKHKKNVARITFGDSDKHEAISVTYHGIKQICPIEF